MISRLAWTCSYVTDCYWCIILYKIHKSIQINELGRPLRAAFFLLIFEINNQACDCKIIPSFKTLKSLALKVSPVDVISEIISEEPVNGYVSVAPKL